MEIRMIEGETFKKLKLCIVDLLAQIDTLHAEPDNGWYVTRTMIMKRHQRIEQLFDEKFWGTH